MPDLAEALRRYADAGDPLDLDAIVQRRRRPPILRAAAVLVTIAAVAAVVTFVRGGDPTTVTTSTVPGLPSAFIALTADGQLQVRSSRDGDVERTVATMTVSGPVSLAVTPDGRSVYLARDRPFKPGECNQPQDTLLDEVVRVDLKSGQIEPIGRGAEPALSPDGRRLAYVRQVDGICRRGIGGQELVIREVGSGRERTIAAGAEGVHLMDSLSWAPGSADLAFRLQYPDTSSPPVVLGVDRAFTLQDAHRTDMSDAHGWFGYLGDTGQVLGLYQQGGDDPKPTALVTLDPVSGHETSRLVTTGDPSPFEAMSDRTGRHLVYTAGEHVYRWSVGQDEPVALGTAIAVAWIPRDAGVVPTLTTSAPFVRGTNVQVRIDGLDHLRGRTVELTAWTPGPVDTTSGGPRIGYGSLGELAVDERGVAEGIVRVPNTLSGEDDVIPLEPGKEYGLEVTISGGGNDRVRLPMRIDAMTQGTPYEAIAARGAAECGAPPIEVDIDGHIWVPKIQDHFPTTIQHFEGTFTLNSPTSATFVAPDGTTTPFEPGVAWGC